jgi:hypothetical protein
MKVNPGQVLEWLWIDAWDESPVQIMPSETRGLYREMHSQAWRLGGSLEDDPQTIQRLTNSTPEEWARNWPRIQSLWRVENGRLWPIEDLGGAKLPNPKFARPWIPLAVKAAVFARDGAACVICGRIELLELDHIVPFSRGGSDTVENLRVLCKPCNSRRGAILRRR